MNFKLGKIQSKTIRIGFIFRVLTVLIILNACGSNSGEDVPDFGMFEAVVSGEFNQEFSGVAIFGVQQLGPPTGNIFVLSMNSTGSNDVVFAVNVALSTENRPQNGSTALGELNSGAHGEFVFFNPGESQQNFRSVSGQLIITSSSSENLEGEVSFNAIYSNNDTEVNVQATFNATCTPQSIVICD
ncbi:MAG: hypothetical protein ACFCU6_15105 [Balneolaceae bacterium]